MASVDANGDPMISYPGLTDHDLKLTICNLSESTNGNCDQPGDWSTVALGDQPHQSSMATDANGDPMISYFDLANDDLKFAVCNLSESTNGNCDQPGDWSKTTVDDEARYAVNNTSIAVDASGNPMISYYDDVDIAINFASCQRSASTNGNCDQPGDWSTEPVVGSQELGYYTSIAAGANGSPMISWGGGPNRDLKFALGAPDTDGDGFTDYQEVYLGTDPTGDCPDDPGVHDAWPLDMNMDRLINLGGDIAAYIGHMGATAGPPPSANWVQRLDLNADGDINLGGDVVKYVGKMGAECT